MFEKPNLLSPEEVAAALRVSLRKLQDWRANGTGPEFVRLGRNIFYPAGSLTAWLSARTTSANTSIQS
jgi:hypothetical protein